MTSGLSDRYHSLEPIWLRFSRVSPAWEELGGYSHRAGHRTLQFIQEALHAGPNILQAPASISFWLLFHQRPSFSSQRTVILWEAIKGAQGSRQWGARIGLISEIRRQNGCSFLSPPGTQRPPSSLETHSYLQGSLEDYAARHSALVTAGPALRGCCPGRSSSQWVKALPTSACWGSFEKQRREVRLARLPSSLALEVAGL